MSAPQREFEVTLPIGWIDPAGRIHRKAAIRKMRGHEEALLYDASLSPARLVTELIRGCLVRLGDAAAITPELVADLYSADRNYLVVEIRRITLGDRLQASYVCPACGGATAVVEDLGQLAVRRLGDDQRPESVTVELEDGYSEPDGVTHRELRIRLPRGVDEEHIARSTDKDPLRLRDVLILRCIESFGSLRRATLESYGIKILRDLTLGDRRRLYAAIESESPGVDFHRALRCSGCGGQFDAVLDASGFFFRPRPGGRTRLRQEIFYLASHLHWSHGEIMSLDLMERKDYVRMLAERIEADNEAAREIGARLGRG